MHKILKNFIWQEKKAKVKHSALCNGYEMGGIKNVDLRNKIASVQSSWVKRLFEDEFHDWKIIPLFLMGKQLGKNFKFHNNIDITNDILSKILHVIQPVMNMCNVQYMYNKYVNQNCTYEEINSRKRIIEQ